MTAWTAREDARSQMRRHLESFGFGVTALMPVPDRRGCWFVEILADGVIRDDLHQAGNVLDVTLIHGDPSRYLLTVESEPSAELRGPPPDLNELGPDH